MDVEVEVLREQVRVIYEGSLPAAFTLLTLPVAVLATFWSVAPRGALALWGALGFAAGFLITGLGIAHRRARDRESPAALRFWIRARTIETIAVSVAWSAAVPILSPHGSMEARFTLLLIFAGLMGGSIPINGVRMDTFLAYATPMCVTVFSDRLSQGDLTLAFATILYMGALTDSARRFSGNLAQSVRLRVRNLELGARLEGERQAADRMKEKLQFMAREQVLNIELVQKNEALERALREAEAANRARESFLATMSHELRTPLNTIINVPEALELDFKLVDAASCASCGQLFELEPGEQLTATTRCPSCGKTTLGPAAQTHVFAGDSKRALSYLDSVRRCGTQLLGLINELLDYQRVRAGRMDLRRERIDARDVLIEVARTLQPLIHREGQSLDIEAPDPVHLEADPARLRQVLTNLIANASKFFPEGTTIRARIERAGAKARFYVQDQGPGIPAEHRESIFEPFRQLDDGTTKKHGGSGLGLAICKQLVELHGGTIRVTGERGATFVVELPGMIEGARGEANPTSTTAAIG